MPELVFKADLLADIELVELTDMTNGDDTIIDTHIDDAEEEVKTFIRHKYDVVILFAKVDPDRNIDLVKHIRAYALFSLTNRLSPNSIPDNRLTNFEMAEKTLQMIRKGELSPSWDVLVPDVGDDIFISSNNRIGNTY